MTPDSPINKPAKKVGRSRSSGRWLREHFDDPYVKEAQKQGYRSRASFKLLEIQEKDRLIRPGMTVVDLGSAPGGWSQVAVALVGHHGRVIASDILPMDTLAGVDFIHGDFTEEAVLAEILAALGERKADLVISDMAPNHERYGRCGSAARDVLGGAGERDGGASVEARRRFPRKVFHGEGFDELLKVLKGRYKKVSTRKPQASRARSREVYLLAQGFKN
ncbi:MAG: 23S rRNA methyltransferase [Cellvibrionales bacterium]|nr:23S rRNA methyltransferase [Cellvibrionales bacterium]